MLELSPADISTFYDLLVPLSERSTKILESTSSLPSTVITKSTEFNTALRTELQDLSVLRQILENDAVLIHLRTVQLTYLLNRENRAIETCISELEGIGGNI